MTMQTQLTQAQGGLWGLRTMSNLPEWLGRRTKRLHLQNQQNYKNPAQLLLHTEHLTQPLLARAASVAEQRPRSASNRWHRAGTWSQEQWLSNPWSSAWEDLGSLAKTWTHQLSRVTIQCQGETNSRSSLARTRDRHQGWLSGYPATNHTKKPLTPSGKDFIPLSADGTAILVRFTSMPNAKHRKYFLSHSIQTCRGICKKEKKIGKRPDLAALHSLVGKEGWEERKNPEFCWCVQFTFFWKRLQSLLNT